MQPLRTLRIALVAGIAIAVSACTTEAPVTRPCGVLSDSLKTVRGATAADDKRISIHFERGVAAGCWDRQ